MKERKIAINRRVARIGGTQSLLVSMNKTRVTLTNQKINHKNT